MKPGETIFKGKWVQKGQIWKRDFLPDRLPVFLNYQQVAAAPDKQIPGTDPLPGFDSPKLTSRQVRFWKLMTVLNLSQFPGKGNLPYFYQLKSGNAREQKNRQDRRLYIPDRNSERVFLFEV